ncbi:MarR family winged helix-turn-helix transcriptional regulator [Allofustis seminis]|uniref:MarR family winged helix-turn-helix transcriptional regulator n=1 Tax=Allofustis seminis TaxID=166939 RepID=UPI0003730384|nr:MarR family transcriptional regulator [Allofustis seminis]
MSNKVELEILDLINDYYDKYYRQNRLYDNWCDKFGITDHELFILERIYYNDGKCTQKDLVEYLDFTKQTVSSILTRLEKQKYILRKRSLIDCREKLIFLTDKGRKYAGNIVGEMRDLEVKAFKNMSENERITVKKGLKILIENLENSFKN